MKYNFKTTTIDNVIKSLEKVRQNFPKAIVKYDEDMGTFSSQTLERHRPQTSNFFEVHIIIDTNSINNMDWPAKAQFKIME